MKVQVFKSLLVFPTYWFELLVETKKAASASLEPLQKECEELLAIFTTIEKVQVISYKALM